jgi:phosphate/sulfate permease
MENFYLVVVIVLFVLAISDLVVGVSNDAVNFLNSAIGSKAAPFRIIMIIAALGVLFGATFSSGMMEVARKGIFNPHMFTFDNIMIIFLAVMLTDVILLDLFNTLGLPTSTTVSIVFELLGSAVGVAVIRVKNGLADGASIAAHINSETALTIIAGILLSIVIAFTVGAIVQYLTRALFSFNTSISLKYFGAIWGGLALSVIVYFILIKGAKSASFMTAETAAYIKENTGKIFLMSFVALSILLQLFYWLFKLNIPRFVVLVGTFALAMAFAGNDLVNFIGVPLAGYESFKTFTAENSIAASELFMSSLSGPVKTPTFFLLIAGLIMVITLWLSRKAKSVVRTTINLSRQDEGYERFETSALARSLVRSFIVVGDSIKSALPNSFIEKMSARFDNAAQNNETKKDKEVAFDLIRASINLVVASALIAFATSLKLPLSTTYVTFMVAMGTSLADGAWDRESAVYRITGVVTVISGWFLTAFVAFSAAFIMALAINAGGIYAIFGLISLAAFFVIRTHTTHRKREKKELEAQKDIEHMHIVEACHHNVMSTLLAISRLYKETVEALENKKRKRLKVMLDGAVEVNDQVSKYKHNLYYTIQDLISENNTNPYNYVQVIDYLKELSNDFLAIVKPTYAHIDNNHSPFSAEQIGELKVISEDVVDLISSGITIMADKNFDNVSDLELKENELRDNLKKFRKNHIDRIKDSSRNSKNNILFLDILYLSRSISRNSNNVVKAYQSFDTELNK